MSSNRTVRGAREGVRLAHVGGDVPAGLVVPTRVLCPTNDLCDIKVTDCTDVTDIVDGAVGR